MVCTPRSYEVGGALLLSEIDMIVCRPIVGLLPRTQGISATAM